MSDNMKIWDALSKTDPNHTKGFKRSGGFSGTSVKPIWMQRQMTNHFGPSGIGWGVNKPEFQLVESGEETLVYCTVAIWHGERENLVWGVGGDKAIAKNKYGQFADDEAFKKAFTDAQSNAMKALGVAADIHMGLFDDDKYVTEMKKEFAEKPPELSDSDNQMLAAIKAAKTVEDLSQWSELHGEVAAQSDNAAHIRGAYKAKLSQINQPQQKAA